MSLSQIKHRLPAFTPISRLAQPLIPALVLFPGSTLRNGSQLLYYLVQTFPEKNAWPLECQAFHFCMDSL